MSLSLPSSRLLIFSQPSVRARNCVPRSLPPAKAHGIASAMSAPDGLPRRLLDHKTLTSHGGSPLNPSIVGESLCLVRLQFFDASRRKNLEDFAKEQVSV